MEKRKKYGEKVWRNAKSMEEYSIPEMSDFHFIKKIWRKDMDKSRKYGEKVWRKAKSMEKCSIPIDIFIYERGFRGFSPNQKHRDTRCVSG